MTVPVSSDHGGDCRDYHSEILCVSSFRFLLCVRMSNRQTYNRLGFNLHSDYLVLQPGSRLLCAHIMYKNLQQLMYGAFIDKLYCTLVLRLRESDR